MKPRIPGRMLRIDFHRPRRAARGGWGWLAAGLLMLAVAGGLHHQAAQRLRMQDMEADNVRRQQASQARRAAALVPAFAGELRWQRAAAELAVPWDERLAVVERATTAPVYLLALSQDMRTGTFRLEAEVGQYGDALDYLARLTQGGEAPKPFLQSHDMVQDAQGRPYLHVVVSVPWTAPAGRPGKGVQP